VAPQAAEIPDLEEANVLRLPLRHELYEAMDSDEEGAAGIQRVGYEWGGAGAGETNTETLIAKNGDRKRQLVALAQLYIQCIWVSACVDAAAEAITAGGLEVVPVKSSIADPDPPRTPQLVRLENLLRFVNRREDAIQLLRKAIVDLLVFGDAYLEVGFLLNEPAAIWSLDAASMIVQTDRHGNLIGYLQVLEDNTRVPFTLEQVIHVSVDAPRGGIYGCPPTQKVEISATAWLWALAALKQMGKDGFVSRIHVDYDSSAQDKEIQRWWQRYLTRNRGVRNMATPVVTKNAKTFTELNRTSSTEILSTLKDLRDQIVSGMHTPPQKVQIVESGNLGGGTGEAQDKTWRGEVVGPIGNLLLEKLNYSIVQQGFGITDWEIRFGQIDYRDSAIVETIRDLRLRNGAWSLNDYERDIQQAETPGGDIHVLVTRQAVLDWENMKNYAAMTMGPPGGAAPGAAAKPPSVPSGLPDPPDDADPGESSPAAAMIERHGGDDAFHRMVAGKTPADAEMGKLTEAWAKAYAHRRKQALRQLAPPKESE
jgi:hypothetical protein